ncbi:hypothetical protein OPT61_g5938 [Boeremia exigua]|uniref:Uncharacterized protein n=1 Tax=Boeremia exigua TaxID=749465 RepID=A0ACC2I8I6_9PLEO|nr:hypothetical protein OPT61_g5938 [Boeremia exigua]
MSADLFAEFSTDSSQNKTQEQEASFSQQPASAFSFFDGLNSQTSTAVSQPPPFAQSFGYTSTPPVPPTTDDASDDWGDFEGGSNVDPAPSAQHDPFALLSNQQFQHPQQTWTGQSTAHDQFSFEPAGAAQPSQESWTKAPIIKAKKPVDSNVLFDAEEDFDDDFGDFEDSQPKAVTPAPSAPLAPAGASSAVFDLLGDLDLAQPAPLMNNEASKTSGSAEARARRTVGTATTLKPKQPKPKPKPAPAPTAQIADDGWDTFDDWEASIPTAATKGAEVKGTSVPTSLAPAPMLSSAVDDIPRAEQPPTNVPPPGVLLSLFPSFFAEAHEQLFKPMAAQTLPMRNKLLAEPGTIAYLQGFLMLASVAARIIAGRKLRWKRDQHLSQGMRIGPASSRATSGMKLTCIDRGENLKEEREASDVVRAWKDQVGRLRHVISGVNQIKAGTLGPAPDLQETLPVRTLKQSEGGVPARQPCMLCGLKRDERVTAADMAVEDSFGEWWIEQVNMHRGRELARELFCRPEMKASSGLRRPCVEAAKCSPEPKDAGHGIPGLRDTDRPFLCMTGVGQIHGRHVLSAHIDSWQRRWSVRTPASMTTARMQSARGEHFLFARRAQWVGLPASAVSGRRAGRRVTMQKVRPAITRYTVDTRHSTPRRSTIAPTATLQPQPLHAAARLAHQI